MNVKRKPNRLIKPIFILLILFVLSCSDADPPDRQDMRSCLEDSIFLNTDYSNLRQVFGDITKVNIFDIAQDIFDNLNSAAMYGDITKEDSVTIHKIVCEMRDWIVYQQSLEEGSGTKLSKGLELLYQNDVGDIFTDIVNALGTGVLLENIYPVLEYIVNIDYADVTRIQINNFGISSNFSNGDIEDLKEIILKILNPDGPYGGVYNSFSELQNIINKREESTTAGVTVGDFKKMLSDFLPDMDNDQINSGEVVTSIINGLLKNSQNDKIDLGPVLEVFSELWEKEEDFFKENISDILYALSQLLSDTDRSVGPDGWGWANGKMTDCERILYCLEDLLNPAILNRDTLKHFLNQVYDNVDLLKGADSLRGILQALSTLDTQYLDEMDTSIYKYFFMNNIYGEERETSDIQISVARALLYLMDTLYPIADRTKGPIMSRLLSLISAENIKASEKDHLLKWFIGLMIEGSYHYPEYHEFISGPNPNPLEGVDWVFYEQNFIFLIKFDGLYGLLKILLKKNIISNAADYLAGGLVDPLPAIIELTGGNGEAYTTGERHKLFALLCPILKYYQDNGYIINLIEFITCLNEIDPKTYKPLALKVKENSTFRQKRLGHVLENFEGPYGYGMLYYGFRGKSEDDKNNEADILDPLLNVLVKILKECEKTELNGGNLIDYILSEKNKVVMTKEDGIDIDALFICGGSLDKLNNFLSENHSDLVEISKCLGNIFLALSHDLKNFSSIHDILLKAESPKIIKSELKKETNREAIKSLIRLYMMRHFHISSEEWLDANISSDEALINEILNTIEALFTCSDDLIDDLIDIVSFFIKRDENASSDKEMTTASPKKIFSIMKDELKYDNSFSTHLKILACRAFGVYDDIYNYRGIIDDSTPFLEALEIILGNGSNNTNGMYDLKPILNLIDDLLKLEESENTSINSDVINPELPSKSGEVNDSLSLSLRLIRSLFISYDDRAPTAFILFKLINLKEVDGTAMNFNNILKEVIDLINRNCLDPRNNPDFYNAILDILNLAADKMQLL